LFDQDQMDEDPMPVESETLRRVRGRHGDFWVWVKDNTIGTAFTHYGEWADQEVQLFLKLLGPGAVVVEAGANLGAHTVPLARCVGATGRIYAFEPMTFSHQLLCANLIANGICNVRTHQAALGQVPGELAFPIFDPLAGGPNNYGGVSTAIESETTPCLATTVDRLDLSRLDLLKIDVEGGERDVLMGAMETIARTRPFLFVESFNHAAATMAEDGHRSWLLDHFSGMDYAFFHCITPLHEPHAFRGGDVNIFPGQWSFDILGVPRERGELTGLPPATDSMFDAPPRRPEPLILHPPGGGLDA